MVSFSGCFSIFTTSQATGCPSIQVQSSAPSSLISLLLSELLAIPSSLKCCAHLVAMTHPPLASFYFPFCTRPPSAGVSIWSLAPEFYYLLILCSLSILPLSRAKNSLSFHVSPNPLCFLSRLTCPTVNLVVQLDCLTSIPSLARAYLTHQIPSLNCYFYTSPFQLRVTPHNQLFSLHSLIWLQCLAWPF